MEKEAEDPGPAAEAARALIRAKLAHEGDARYLEFAPIDQVPEQPGTLHYGSVYMHRIGNQLHRFRDATFIISNTFLSSHAYNLGLVMLVYRNDPAQQAAALRSNFKKFYAECALGASNCLIGRALLIETLMYEQDLAREIFSAVEQDSVLAEQGRVLVDVMSTMLNIHELTHHFERNPSAEWQQDVAALYGGALAKARAKMLASGHADDAIELVCDAVGAWQVWNDKTGIGDRVPSLVTRLRLCAFGFLCFGELASLQRSAHLLAARAAEEDAAISLGADKRTPGTFTIWRDRDAGMDRRVAAIVGLLQAEAERQGTVLFAHDPDFPLLPETPAMLRDAFDRFDEAASDNPPGLTGTDLARRGLAQLLAESLHHHPEGAAHLLWRSKRFTQSGMPLDP